MNNKSENKILLNDASFFSFWNKIVEYNLLNSGEVKFIQRTALQMLISSFDDTIFDIVFSRKFE